MSEAWYNPELEWIGVDLDGTLAELDLEKYKQGDPTFIGPPIKAMVELVQKWTAEGKIVKIFTARVAPLTSFVLGTRQDEMERIIHQWLNLHLGFDLEVTCIKDCYMTELWDDIELVKVIQNSGGLSDNSFKLHIAPAVPPPVRHKIEDLLKDEGYKINGSGQYVDFSMCDISFYKED